MLDRKNIEIIAVSFDLIGTIVFALILIRHPVQLAQLINTNKVKEVIVLLKKLNEAIVISEGTFKIFYSHSRDLYGIPDPFGKYVLIYVENLENLSSFFKNIYPPNTTTPFEVSSVKSSLLNTVADHDNHDIRQGTISNEKEIQLEKRRAKV